MAGVRRVVLTGPESTGKTTLARQLADDYRTEWSPEYARTYAGAKGAPLDADDVEPIARGQIAVEDAALAAARGVAFLDTDLVSTAVYARHYYGGCPPWIEHAVRERRADLYLLLAPDVPWVADPERDRPHRREELHDLFRAKLDEIGAHYAAVAGAWEERRRQARAAVDALLR